MLLVQTGVKPYTLILHVLIRHHTAEMLGTKTLVEHIQIFQHHGHLLTFLPAVQLVNGARNIQDTGYLNP